MTLTIILTIVMAIIAFLSLIIAYLEHRKAKSSIVIIKQYFPYIKVIEKFPKEDKKAKEKINNNYSVIRNDLIVKEAYLLSPISQYKKIIERLIYYLDKRDIDILIVCSAILRAQDDNQHTLATQIHILLVRKYGERGKHIYNRFNTGVFKENILPYLEELENILGQDKITITRLFQDYYVSVIKFVVDRIWIGNGDTMTSVRWKIQNRFNIYSKLELLWIYARKDKKVTIAKMGCQDFINNNEGFELKEVDKKILRGKIAVTYQIIKKKKPKKIN